jgi:signal peptidase I
MAWQRLVVGRSLSLTLTRALLIALTLLLTSQYVISPVRAYGISMQPTVAPGARWPPTSW